MSHLRRAVPGFLCSSLLGAAALFSAGCTSFADFSECTENSDCRQNYGSLFHCADDGICDNMTRSMLQAPCDRNYGALNQPDAVAVGVILPTSGAMAGIANPVLQAMYLAVDDINAMGGLNEQPLVLIICDTAGIREQARAGARYLIDELDVPAILGPFSAAEAYALADIARQSEVPMVSPSVTDANFTTLNDGGYMWRTVARDTKQGEAMARMVEHIIDTEVPRHRDEIRLAMVVGTNIYSETLRRSFTEHMIQGGYLDFERGITGGTQVEIITYPETINLDQMNGPDTPIFQALRNLAEPPDIIVWLGEPDLWGPMLEFDRFRRAQDSSRLLFHVMSDFAKDVARAEMGDKENEGRIWGTALQTNADASYAPFQSFRTLYRDTWIYDPIEVQYASNGWDAVYALAIAARGRELTGPSIRDGLAMISGDDNVAEASRSGLQSAYNFVEAGQTFRLDGASGPISFNTETGDIHADRDIILWCYFNSGHTELGAIFDGESFIPRTCMDLVQPGGEEEEETGEEEEETGEEEEETGEEEGE